MAYQTILTDTPESLIRRYHAVLSQNGVNVDQLILFGSYAKGTARSDSDVDVCVVSDTFGKNRLDEMVKLKKLTIPVDTILEPFPFHPDDLNDRYNPLAAEIRSFGKRIV